MRGMQRVVVLGGAALLAVSAVLVAQDLLAVAGVTDAAARREVVSSFTNGYVPVYLAAKAFKAAPVATRVTIARNLTAWARTYTASAAFKAEYEKARQADLPTAPTAKGSVDDELAKQKAEREKSLAEAKKNLEKMPANLRSQMEATIKQMEEQFKAMDKDAQMQAITRQSIEMSRAEDQKNYQERLKAHDKAFPADPNVLIARRLREFLATSQDVDFGAKLVANGSQRRFADARYEDKSRDWKLCYRAGKDATDAARAEAQAWLNALGVK